MLVNFLVVEKLQRTKIDFCVETKTQKTMQHIIGKDRHQISFGSLDEQIAKDNPVRVIDAFVEKLDLSVLGFV
jgi:hypothetical protein